MNFMQQQYAPQRTVAYPNNGWNNRIRPVSSIEEVKAASIDFDGSIFYFSDLANKRIYTKQINLDGTATLNMYELKEAPIMEQPLVDTSNYVTRKEFESAMAQLRDALPKPVSAPETKPMEPKAPTAFNF